MQYRLKDKAGAFFPLRHPWRIHTAPPSDAKTHASFALRHTLVELRRVAAWGRVGDPRTMTSRAGLVFQAELPVALLANANNIPSHFWERMKHRFSASQKIEVVHVGASKKRDKALY
ncbi:unnamed protein product [Ixodes pacificus]